MWGKQELTQWRTIYFSSINPVHHAWLWTKITWPGKKQENSEETKQALEQIQKCRDFGIVMWGVLNKNIQNVNILKGPMKKVDNERTDW